MQSACHQKFQEKKETVRSGQTDSQHKPKNTRKRPQKKQQQVQVELSGNTKLIQASSSDKNRSRFSSAPKSSRPINNNNNDSSYNKQQQYISVHSSGSKEKPHRGNDVIINSNNTNKKTKTCQPVMIDLPDYRELNSNQFSKEQRQLTTKPTGLSHQYQLTSGNCSTNNNNSMDRSSSINHHYKPVTNYNNSNNISFDRPNQRLSKNCLNNQQINNSIVIRQDQQQTCFDNASSYRPTDNCQQETGQQQIDWCNRDTQQQSSQSHNHQTSPNQNFHRHNQLDHRSNGLYQQQQQPPQISMNHHQLAPSMEQQKMMGQHHRDQYTFSEDAHNQYPHHPQMQNSNLIMNQQHEQQQQQQQQQHINGGDVPMPQTNNNNNYIQSQQQQANSQIRLARSQQSMPLVYSPAPPVTGHHQSQQIDNNVNVLINNNNNNMLMNQQQQQPNKLYGSQQSQQHLQQQSVAAPSQQPPPPLQQQQQLQNNHPMHHHHQQQQQQAFVQNPMNEVVQHATSSMMDDNNLGQPTTMSDPSMHQQYIMQQPMMPQPNHHQQQTTNGHTNHAINHAHLNQPPTNNKLGNNYNQQHHQQLQQNHIGYANNNAVGPVRQTHQPVRNVPYTPANQHRSRQQLPISRHQIPQNQVPTGPFPADQQQIPNQQVIVNACSPFDQDQYTSPSPNFIQSNTPAQPIRIGPRSNQSMNVAYQQQLMLQNEPNNGNEHHQFSNQQQYDPHLNGTQTMQQQQQQQQSYVGSEHLNATNTSNQTGISCFNNSNSINGQQQQHMTQSHYQSSHYQMVTSPTVASPITHTNQQQQPVVQAQHNPHNAQAPQVMPAVIQPQHQQHSAGHHYRAQQQQQYQQQPLQPQRFQANANKNSMIRVEGQHSSPSPINNHQQQNPYRMKMMQQQQQQQQQQHHHHHQPPPSSNGQLPIQSPVGIQGQKQQVQNAQQQPNYGQHHHMSQQQPQQQQHHHHHQNHHQQQPPFDGSGLMNNQLNGQRVQTQGNGGYYSPVNSSNNVSQSPITTNQQPPMIAPTANTNPSVIHQSIPVAQQQQLPMTTQNSNNVGVVHNQPPSSTNGMITNYGTSPVVNSTPPIHHHHQQQQQQQQQQQYQHNQQQATGNYNNAHQHSNSMQTNNPTINQHHQVIRPNNNMIKSTNNHYMNNNNNNNNSNNNNNIIINNSNSNSNHLHNHPNPIGNPTPPLTPTSGPQQRLDHVNGLPNSVIPAGAYLSSPTSINSQRQGDILQKSLSSEQSNQSDNLEPTLTIVNDIILAPFKLDHEAQYSSFEFHLKPQTFQLLKNHGQDYELQFKAFPVNDPKCQTDWPNGFELSVNHQIMAPNNYQSRKPLDVKTFCCIGQNLLELTITACCCSHLFSLEFVERRKIKFMMARIISQNQLPREHFVQRIRRDFNSFACNNHKNLDHSDGIEQTAIKMTLKCPITKQRIQVPVRGRDCKHLTCFDLEPYLMLHGQKQSNDWRCPICNTLAPYHKLEVDNYIRSIIENNSYSFDIDDIMIDSNAAWKPSFVKSNQLNSNNNSLLAARCNSSQQRQQAVKQTSANNRQPNNISNSNNTLSQSIGSPAFSTHNNICLPVIGNKQSTTIIPPTNNTSGYIYDPSLDRSDVTINKSCDGLDPLTAMERSLMQHEQQMGPPFIGSNLMEPVNQSNATSANNTAQNTSNSSCHSITANGQGRANQMMGNNGNLLDNQYIDKQQTTDREGQQLSTNLDNNNSMQQSVLSTTASITPVTTVPTPIIAAPVTITRSCTSTPATPSSTILANCGPETPATPSNSGGQHCGPPSVSGTSLPCTTTTSSSSTSSSSASLSSLLDNQQHSNGLSSSSSSSSIQQDVIHSNQQNFSNNQQHHQTRNGDDNSQLSTEPDQFIVDNNNHTKSSNSHPNITNNDNTSNNNEQDSVTRKDPNDLNDFNSGSLNGSNEQREPDPLDLIQDDGVDQLELLDYLNSSDVTGNSSSTPDDAILDLFNN